METPQHLPAFKLTTNPFFVEERIHQINVLLERNFYVISDLEKVLTSSFSASPTSWSSTRR